jgi:hypothetical protein
MSLSIRGARSLTGICNLSGLSGYLSLAFVQSNWSHFIAPYPNVFIGLSAQRHSPCLLPRNQQEYTHRLLTLSSCLHQI